MLKNMMTSKRSAKEGLRRLSCCWGVYVFFHLFKKLAILLFSKEETFFGKAVKSKRFVKIIIFSLNDHQKCKDYSAGYIGKRKRNIFHFFSQFITRP